MGIEIERKFLVRDGSYRHAGRSEYYRQGYLCPGSGPTIRVRTAGEQGYITVKGRREGIRRSEFEYRIPCGEAEEMLDTLCDPPLIEKYRYTVVHQGMTWVIDEFLGDNEGLVVAEIELQTEEQEFTHPPWLGEEVTDDGRYSNASLRLHPYTRWAADAAPR